MPDEKQRAALTTARGKQAAAMSDRSAKKAFIAESGLVDTDYAKAAEGSSARGNEAQKKQILGSFKKGGTVPKTGNYKLHKGETVVPTDPNPAATLGSGDGVPWKSHTEYLAREQAKAAGGFEKHKGQAGGPKTQHHDLHAGVKAANKESRSRYDATHRHKIGEGK